MKGRCLKLIRDVLSVSTKDYPNKICSTIFTQGCNWNCTYCHNKNLISINTNYLLTIPEVMRQLNKNKLIEAVCITGGEPTIHHVKLSVLCKSIKRDSPNLSIKLDTNGSDPKFLKYLLENNFVDFIDMDIKSSWENYEKVTRTKVNIKDIFESINLIKKYGWQTDYRFRLINNFPEDLEIMKEYIQTEKYIITNI